MLDINNLLEFKNGKIEFKKEYIYIKNIIYKYKTHITIDERISILYMVLLKVIKKYNIEDIESLNTNIAVVYTAYYNELFDNTSYCFYTDNIENKDFIIDESININDERKELLYTFDYILTSKQRTFLHNIDDIYTIDSNSSKIIKRIALRYKQVLNINDYTFKNLVNKKLYDLINASDLESKLRLYADKKIIIDILYNNDNGLITEDFKHICNCINNNVPLPTGTKEKILKLFKENIIK